MQTYLNQRVLVKKATNMIQRFNS